MFYFRDFKTKTPALISSGLDYCNTLYFGVSQTILSRLQLVNKTKCKKSCHITPTLA